MKTLAHFLCGVLCLSAVAQDHSSHDHPSHAKEHPVTLVTGLGDLHHPVSTKNPQAQQFILGVVYDVPIRLKKLSAKRASENCRSGSGHVLGHSEAIREHPVASTRGPETGFREAKVASKRAVRCPET